VNTAARIENPHPQTRRRYPDQRRRSVRPRWPLQSARASARIREGKGRACRYLCRRGISPRLGNFGCRDGSTSTASCAGQQRSAFERLPSRNATEPPTTVWGGSNMHPSVRPSSRCPDQRGAGTPPPGALSGGPKIRSRRKRNQPAKRTPLRRGRLEATTDSPHLGGREFPKFVCLHGEVPRSCWADVSSLRF
jgi:hypothetical protein